MTITCLFMLYLQSSVVASNILVLHICVRREKIKLYENLYCRQKQSPPILHTFKIEGEGGVYRKDKGETGGKFLFPGLNGIKCETDVLQIISNAHLLRNFICVSKYCNIYFRL